MGRPWILLPVETKGKVVEGLDYRRLAFSVLSFCQVRLHGDWAFFVEIKDGMIVIEHVMVQDMPSL